jgi:spore germination protein YaaH
VILVRLGPPRTVRFRGGRGVDDLKALGDCMDFVSLMTYDQHTRWTTLGPVAGWDWTLANLDYALQFIPKEKLSLGIPLYGYHWLAGNPVVGTDERSNISPDYIDADESIPLAKQYGARNQWDAQDHAVWWVSAPECSGRRTLRSGTSCREPATRC